VGTNITITTPVHLEAGAPRKDYKCTQILNIWGKSQVIPDL